MKKYIPVLLIGVLMFALLVLGMIWVGKKEKEKEKERVFEEAPFERSLPPATGQGSAMCTMDAKQCSDGSFVGRVAPKCDFAPCPNEK